MKKLKTITILQSILILILVFILAVVFLVKKVHSNKIQTSLDVNEIPSEQTFSEEEEIFETTSEKIYIHDPKTGKSWVPVLADVPACQYHPDQFVTRNNLTYYTENNKIVSKFGIDVSEHDGEIDWATVKKAGVEFAFLRVGYRGYSEGKIVSDAYLERNIQGALENDIDIGLYFYSQAITPQEALEEAEFVLSAVGDTKITYPIVYDWEFVTTDTARTDDISPKMLTKCSITFCERIKQAGYLPMIYQNKNTSLLNLYLSKLTDYDFWLAEYNSSATYYYNYQIWQYSSSGTVPGIKGEVDMNICFKDYTNPDKKESDENA